MGMAKPMPSTIFPLLLEYLAETIPTTSPDVLSRGPPELPGLMEVSVWIMWKGVPETLMARFTLDSMPPLREKVSSPSGLPMANMRSPTFSVSLLPRTARWRPDADTFKTAMS